MNRINDEGEKDQDIQVKDFSDGEILAYFEEKEVPISTLPPTLWKILIGIWLLILGVSLLIWSLGLFIANIAAILIILALGFWQTNYPEQIIIECMGRFYQRKKAGWGFIIPGVMKIRSRMKIGPLQLIDIRTDEKAPIAIQDDSIDISAVAGTIVTNIILATYEISISKTFKEKRPNAPDWAVATEEAIDTSYRTMLGGKKLEEVIDETSDVKNKIQDFREKKDKHTIKSQLNQDTEALADSITKVFGINISYLNTKEIILTTETKKKRRELQDLAVDIRKQDAKTVLETKKIKTELRKKAQEKVKGDAAGLNLGSNIEKAATTAGVEPGKIVNLLAIKELARTNTTIFTTSDKDGGISIPAIGAALGAGSEAGKKDKKKPVKEKTEENDTEEESQE